MKTLKTKFPSRNKYTKLKDLVLDIESNIDPLIFCEFEHNYDELCKMLENVKDGFGTEPHALLMNYLFFVKSERINELEQEKAGV